MNRDDQLTVENDIIIGRAGARDLHGDLYRPAPGTANGAGVLLIHGGGWSKGSKDMLPPQARVLAAHGFTVLANEYRLTPESPWPTQIHDVKAAMRWLRSQAGDLGLDANRLAVQGNSAGGHLALMLAGTVGMEEFEGDSGTPGVDTSVSAVVAVYPAVSFYVGERTSGANNADALLLDAADSETARRASPTSYARADFPPTFFLHGNADKVVPVSASLNMYSALAQAGAVAEMHIYAEQPHGWARWPNWVAPTMGEAALFLTRYLVDGETYADPAE